MSPESRTQGWEVRLRRRVAGQAIRVLGAFGIALVLASCAGSRAKAPVETSPSQAVPLPTSVPTKAIVLSTSFEDTGAVHVVDLGSGTVLRRIDTGQNPDVALDRTGDHLILLSGSPAILSFIDLPSFAERKRISIEDRIRYIGIGPASLLLSADDRLIFILHRKVLGDDWARAWLTAHDASSGQQRGQVELGNCGAVYLSQGPDARFLYATCAQGVLHILRTDPLREDASMSIPFNFNGTTPGWTAVVGGAVSPDGTRYVAITMDLRLFVVELPSRKTEVITRWSVPHNVARGDMALDTNDSHVWIAVQDRDRAVQILDLTSGQLEKVNIPGLLTSFAIIGDRILYTRGTRLQELKGTLDVDSPAISGEEGHRRVLVAP